MNQLCLKELRTHKLHPIQPFSEMKGTKIKTIRTVKAIARHQSTKIMVANVESFNHHSGHKKDLFGIFDALAVERRADGTVLIRGLQACGSNDWQEHIRKLQENILTCELWLAAGNTTIELWGWRKVKRKGHRVFRPKMQLITLAFLKGKETGKAVEVFGD